MREMYGVVYLTGGMFESLYVFDKYADALKTYEDFFHEIPIRLGTPKGD